MADEDWVLADADINVAVGAELRAAREAAGLTRPELVAQLPFKSTVPTLLNWELGHRAVSYARLVETARVLGRPAPDLMRRAIERVDAIQTLMVEVDLAALRDDPNPAFALLRRWATNRLAAKPDSGTTVRVHHTVVREWAVLLGLPLPDLVRHLETVGR